MDSTEALKQIRELARLGLYRMTRHAAERMEERGATARDVRKALVFAIDCRAAESNCWKVTGKDTDEDDLTMIVVIEDQVVVITILSG